MLPLQDVCSEDVAGIGIEINHAVLPSGFQTESDDAAILLPHVDGLQRFVGMCGFGAGGRAGASLLSSR